MSRLPIVHMTLYKHGVGFFQRRGSVDGEAIKLTFRRDEMDDLLKSLTVIDHSGGQVRGVDYDTPQSKSQRLEGCSVILGDRRSLRDLLKALRGREVQLKLNNGNNIAGTLLGLDETDDKPLKRLLVTILEKENETATVITLEQLAGVELIDTTSASDLRFFLQTATGQETHRSITIRLNPGTHDLQVSYIAPAPGWRVSYRMVMEEKPDKKSIEISNDEDKYIALLQGWGIFDNRLEEDLEAISLSLTAGMPISFIYDLYTPHTPKRPVVKEEARVAAAPIMFEAALADFAEAEAEPPPMAAAASPTMGKRMGMRRAAAGGTQSLDAMAESVEPTASGEAMGELFQYNVNVPVTVGRGQSAMVPIISNKLAPKKDLIYNGQKMAAHPVATLRFQNNTGLTLERGPVTVMENGEYVGEAVLPFTTDKAETVVSYAIELGVHIKEEVTSETQLHALHIKDRFLVHQRYDIRKTMYRIDNRTPQDKSILIERPVNKHFKPFDTVEPEEKTIDTYRYKVTPAAGKLTEFLVQERFLRSHHEEIRNLGADNLKRFFEDKFLDKQTYKELKSLLDSVAEIRQMELTIKQKEERRKTIYSSQDQIQKKMNVLTQAGEEGRLRGDYVKRLTLQEKELEDIEKTISQTRAEMSRKDQLINQLIANLSQ
jgi:hypothetical protein